MDVDPSTQQNNVNDLLASLSSGTAMTYLKVVIEKINGARNKAKELQNAVVDGKKITDYDYYKTIEQEFSKIYSGISNYAVLPTFGFSNEEIGNLDKIKEKPLDQRKTDIRTILDKFGMDLSKVDFSNPQSVTTEFLGQIGNKLVSSKSTLEKLTGELYFEEINDMTKSIEEYAYIYTVNKTDTDEKRRRFVSKSLYEKAYETNKKVLIDVYETATHEKINLNDPDPTKGFTLVRNYLNANYPELIVSMKNPPRIDVAHSKYEAVDNYTSEQLSALSTRNFITAIIGVLIKTNSIADAFEKYVGKVEKFSNSSLDLSGFVDKS